MLKYDGIELAAGMSKPLGFVLAGMFVLKRGEFVGDEDFSENVVAGDSAPPCGFDEFHPKKEVKPPAGDFGLCACPLLSEP